MSVHIIEDPDARTRHNRIHSLHIHLHLSYAFDLMQYQIIPSTVVSGDTSVTSSEVEAAIVCSRW